MAHTLWPLGVDALFSFSGNTTYLRKRSNSRAHTIITTKV